MDINNPKTRACAIARSSCVDSIDGSISVVDAPVGVARKWMHQSTFGDALARELGGGVLRGGLPGS